MSDADNRRHQARVERARIELPDPPPARTHAERMAAAAGVRLHDGDLRYRPSHLRRIVKHRNDDGTP